MTKLGIDRKHIFHALLSLTLHLENISGVSCLPLILNLPEGPPNFLMLPRYFSTDMKQTLLLGRLTGRLWFFPLTFPYSAAPMHLSGPTRLQELLALVSVTPVPSCLVLLTHQQVGSMFRRDRIPCGLLIRKIAIRGGHQLELCPVVFELYHQLICPLNKVY